MAKSLNIIFCIFAGLLCLAGFVFLLIGPKGYPVFASTTDGTVSGYAWSSQIGWINFGYSQGSVHVIDSGLTGYAWNENTGRINLNPTTSGVKNNSEGTLSGYAWCEGTGWINFSGVTINSQGRFSGTATGDNSVSVSFSCDQCNVQTDWRPASTRGGGGLPSGAYSRPAAPFSILINDENQYTNSSTVTLKIQAGSDVKKMAISNSAVFENAVQEDFKATKIWTLGQGDGLKTIYAKFYTQYGQMSEVVQDSIILDTQAPEIKITSIKEKYSPDEEIIIGGTSEAEAQITLFIDADYTIFKADKEGNWLISLGKMAAGQHYIELTPKDFAGNIGKTITAYFSIEPGVVPTPVAILPPLLQKIKEGLTPLLPKVLKPKELKPAKVVTLPKVSPVALRSSWQILPIKQIKEYDLYAPRDKQIKRFVLSPLPADIKLIAVKFPQARKTFTEVGIAKITDVSKLKSANLKLPGLTRTLGLSEVEIQVGKFSLVKGVPIARLTSAAKTKIPSEIVFAKAGGGLVDFNVALSISDKGKVEQTIKTIVNEPIQLIIKTDKPAKKVKGYMIFKSKKPQQTSFQVPLNYLAASSLFLNPELAQKQEKPADVEEKLVLQEFEYEYTGDGVYVANINSPLVDGEYEIITVIDYEGEQIQSKEIRLITVVDPEGYIYEKDKDKETRVNGAIIALFWLNSETKQYELWPAKDFQQENPQTTDVRGTYSFLVPEGHYYLKVDAPGYASYDGKPFEVKEGSGVHINIELKTKYWWLSFFDWKTILLTIVILLLLYNFYRDRMRDAAALKGKS